MERQDRDRPCGRATQGDASEHVVLAPAAEQAEPALAQAQDGIEAIDDVELPHVEDLERRVEVLGACGVVGEGDELLGRRPAEHGEAAP